MVWADVAIATLDGIIEYAAGEKFVGKLRLQKVTVEPIAVKGKRVPLDLRSYHFIYFYVSCPLTLHLCIFSISLALLSFPQISYITEYLYFAVSLLVKGENMKTEIEIQSPVIKAVLRGKSTKYSFTF